MKWMVINIPGGTKEIIGITVVVSKRFRSLGGRPPGQRPGDGVAMILPWINKVIAASTTRVKLLESSTMETKKLAHSYDDMQLCEERPLFVC